MYLNLSDKLNKILIISIKALLFLTALTPLIITWSTGFPYIFGKLVFFRSVVEIALILFLVYLLTWIYTDKKSTAEIGINQRLKSALISIIKNPLFIFTCLFILSLILSAIFAVNSYRAFWGTIDRGEGLFGMLHCFAALFLYLFFFKKNDWLNLFRIYLVGGLILIFYALLQYFKIYDFPFALKFIDPRPGSFIGNAAFLATHMIFVIIFAVIVFSEKTRINADKKLINADTKISTNQRLNAFWKYFSLLIILLAIITIFITGTRGAILGLGTGFMLLLFYFAFKKPLIDADEKLINADNHPHKSAKISIYQRHISAALLIFVLAFGITFWLTRNATIWQKIPGFNRLAQTAFLNINDPSTQTRLITWKLSWKAFKEKPFFGWGPENYLVAYEKHYDPVFASYGETWLDRAHNKIFDLLVTQGILGLLTYLGIFAAAFYLLFKKPLINADKNPIYADENISGNQPKSAAISVQPFIMAGLIAYFVQNLVLFDQLNSDIVFFVILGYLISKNTLIDADNKPIYADKTIGINQQNQHKSASKKILASIIVMIAIGFLGYSVYACNYVPFRQSQEFQKYPNYGDVELAVKNLRKAMYPYNFAQYNIRGSRMDEFFLDKFFYNPDYIKNPKLKPLTNLLIEGIDELGKREPFDIRILLREVEMLNGVTKVTEDEKEAAPLFVKAEGLMREAVKRAPNRQEVYYHLAFNLAGQKRYDESIETARYAVSLNPKVARAHYHLALMLMLAGKNEEAAEELNITENISPNMDLESSGLLKGDLNTVILFYNKQGKADKVAKMIIKSFEGPFRYSRQYYEKSLGYFAEKKDLPHFIETANYLATFDDLKEDMETFMDFVKSGDWDVKYVYNGEGRVDKIAGLLIKSLDEKITSHKFQRGHYEGILGYFIYNKDAENSLLLAGYLANFSDLKDNMEVIVDLLKKGNWDILHNTLGF